MTTNPLLVYGYTSAISSAGLLLVDMIQRESLEPTNIGLLVNAGLGLLAIAAVKYNPWEIERRYMREKETDYHYGNTF